MGARICLIVLAFAGWSASGIADPGTSLEYPVDGCPAEVITSSLYDTTGCVSFGVRFTDIDVPQVDDDIDLIYSNYLRPDVTPPPGFIQYGPYPYMTPENINSCLRSLDFDKSQNEFHKSWNDFELLYNYFHGEDSQKYYGSFGGPNMRFFANDSLNITLDDRNHVDIYFKHPYEGGDDIFPHSPPDPAEDGDPAVCHEYKDNSIQATAGFRGHRDPSNPLAVLMFPDPLWFLGQKHTNVRLSHELQHLIFSSRSAVTPSVNQELNSVAAEYLVRGPDLDPDRPIFNNVYDMSLFSGKPYGHLYLWSAYLMQQFVGDTTVVEDDLFYRWLRTRDAAGKLNNYMLGLARALDSNDYSGLGGSGARPGDERLRAVFHNYSIAKWLNNPSPSFYLGRYGFSRGLIPSAVPLFDNTYNPKDKRTALEVPPRFVVTQAQIAADLDTLTHRWCFLDVNQGGSNISRLTCDSIAVYPYSADYIQFDADPYFATNGKENTFRFQMAWLPDSLPGLSKAGNSLRVSAITYPVRSDSLYLYGTTATRVVDGCVDLATGTLRIGIPGFGTSVKSVVVVIDLADQRPESSFVNVLDRRLYYDYSFGVDTLSGEALVLDAAGHRESPLGPDLLSWTDAQGKGMSGYVIQRAIGTTNGFAPYDSCGCGVNARSETIPGSGEVYYYRVVSRTNPLWVSNVVSPGGHVMQSHTIAGSFFLSGDLTVDVGKTLTVAPGARVKVYVADSQRAGADTSKAEVIVNGSINAIGTAADSVTWESGRVPPGPGDWRGMIINSPGASSQLAYNNIRHGYHGLQVVNAQPNYAFKISHTRIQHSQFYGLYVQGGYPEVNYSVLEQNHGAEIAVVNSASPKIEHCVLRYVPGLGAGAVDDGAVYATGGTGTLRWSSITGVGTGLYCVNASPWLRGVASSPDSMMYGRNSITEFVNYGVRAIDASPNLGQGAGDATQYFSGHNNIFTTTAPTAPFVSYSGSGQIKARWNYWGASPPDPSRFLGSIDGPSTAYLTTFETPAGPGFNPVVALVNTDRALEEAWGMEYAQDFDDAAQKYSEIIAGHPEDPAASDALVRLMAMRIRNGRAADEVSRISGLASGNQSTFLARTAKRLAPQVLAAAGDRASARTAYEELLSDSQFDRKGVLFELAVTEGMLFRDASRAQAALAELRRCCTDPGLLRHAQAMIGDLVGNQINASNGAAVRVEDVVRPIFALEQCAPNPMNPSTHIGYSTPLGGRVTLRIFDVQGRLVRTLFDGRTTPGPHEVYWEGRSDNGNAVSSGVYYYRLENAGHSLVRKIIVVR